MALDWTKTAFIFPGQGSQEVGMGKDFATTYDIARQTFEQADDIINFPLSKLLFDGPEVELNDTMNTQPAMYICSIAILRTLQQELPATKPAFTAGHSLGELTALTAAGALSFEDGVKLVRERGRLMKEAGNTHPGGMAAILGLSNEQVHEVCRQASEQVGKPLVLANDNCPGQIVISGDVDALEAALPIAEAMGAKRALRLAVSVAPHSPLMASAEATFAKLVEQTTFQTPQIPVYANITGKPLTSIEQIHKELEDQLTNPVHWTAGMNQMIADGAETFVEVGSKNVLTGLLKRIDRSKTRINIDTVAAMQAFIAQNA